MTPNETALKKVNDELEEVEQRSAQILSVDATDELDAELKELAAKKDKLMERRSAIRMLLKADEEKSIVLESGLDAEAREKRSLIGKASLTNFFTAFARGAMPSGAEAELQAACSQGMAEPITGIPLEIFEDTKLEQRADVATGVPGTVGVNLDRIRPQVFANSVVPKLGVEMPRVTMGGTYASATLSTPLTAGPKAPGAAQEATAASFTVTTTTPKRITARLGIRIEDVAAVGQENFESILRENLSLVLSDELDDQGLNGDRPANPTGDDVAKLDGLFKKLTSPTTAPNAVADFDFFASAHAGGVDGLWAETIKEVSIVANPLTYALAAKTFQSATNYKGEMSAASYATMNTGGFWTNKRMPDAPDSGTFENVAPAILYRMGRSMMGGNAGAGMRTAVCPHYNEISIDDIYSGSAKGERYFTMHVLLGDVIIVQPDAYKQIQYKVA